MFSRNHFSARSILIILNELSDVVGVGLVFRRFERSLDTVSYTHLDVYKRQAGGRLCAQRRPIHHTAGRHGGGGRCNGFYLSLIHI